MIPEDVEHVVFNCPWFDAYRAKAEIEAGARLPPENILDETLSSEKKLEGGGNIHEGDPQSVEEGGASEESSKRHERSSWLILPRDVIPKWQSRGLSEEEEGGFSE